MSLIESITVFLKQSLSPSSIKHGYSKHIEQYRGLCALLVFIEHATLYPSFVVSNFKWPAYFSYFGAGHISVIVFFCISGYVIGINYDTDDLNIKDYLKKRLVRLYPIYVIAVLTAAFLAGGFTTWEIIKNLLFLQNSYPYIHFYAPIILNVTWSLNYEVFYYLLFIGLFLLRPKIWCLILVMLILTIISIHSGTTTVVFVNYLDGLYIWLLGLMLGWSIFKFKIATDKFVPLLSMLFLQLCFQHLDLGLMIIHIFKINTITNLDYILNIPFCLMIMCILTSKDNLFLRFNKILCYASPAFVFIFLIINNRIFEDLRWIMCLIYWLLSLLFYYEKRISAFLLEKLTYMGKISYGFYLLHIPVAIIIKKTVFINNHTLEVIVKYTLWVGLTFAVSFLLERVVQPRIKKYFFEKKIDPVPA